MANFSIKADLLKVRGAFTTNIKGRTATKCCLCIPIEDSGLYLGKKGCYLTLSAYELQNPKFDDTHCLKVAYDREAYDKMSDEERRQIPIIGGMRAVDRQPEAMLVTDFTEPSDESTLPF